MKYKQNPVTTSLITQLERSINPALTNAEMIKSVHVYSSWMMNKALSAHGCAISAVTSKTLLYISEHVC